VHQPRVPETSRTDDVDELTTTEMNAAESGTAGAHSPGCGGGLAFGVAPAGAAAAGNRRRGGDCWPPPAADGPRGTHGIQVVHVGGWPAPFGITLVADLLQRLMVLLAGIIGVAVAVYSLGHRSASASSFRLLPAAARAADGVSGPFLTATSSTCTCGSK
jgi:hypothetical protein